MVGARQPVGVGTPGDTDTLTGLLNRRAWDHVLRVEEKRIALGDATVVAVLTIDHVDRINEIYGRAGGDRYLAKAGAALRQAVRATHFVARLAGTEFGVILHDCAAADGDARVQDLYDALRAEDGWTSCGWTAVPHGERIQARLQLAEGAMWQAQKQRLRAPMAVAA